MKKVVACLTVGLAAVLSAADFNVRDFGGSVPKAAEAAAKAGGGRIVVPKGTWTSGTIWLKDHCELHLEKGATVVGSTKAADYNANDVFPENFWSNGEEWSGGHLVMAYKATDVAITGEGVLDGNGPAFFGEPDYDSWFPGYKYGLKLFPTDRTWYRPGPMVAMFLSKNIRIEGVTLKNTPCWTCHIRCCDGLDVRGVTIDADRTIANSDGFSIDCTRNVTVKDCKIFTGDDGFAIRASCRLHAATNLCENIRIENCDVSSCCFGIRYGIGTGTIRNVEVRNCRFHESASGIGFTPIWTGKGRGVHFKNIRHYDCFVGECEYPVRGWLHDIDVRCDDVSFENCTFASLEPVSFGGPASKYSNLSFTNCERKYLDKIKVRYNLRWHNEHPDRSRAFMAPSNGVNETVQCVNCRPSPRFEGALALSFDDRHFDEWRAAEPLFAKYGAHATFFVSGKIDNEAVAAMKYLYERGHSVGLHGLNHVRAADVIAKDGAEKYYNDEIHPQWECCRVCYVTVQSFAYPYGNFSAASDELFRSKWWVKRVRADVPGAVPWDPEGKLKEKTHKPLREVDALFASEAELRTRYRIGTAVLGEACHTDIDEVLACLKRAKERKELVSFTSHGISADAKFVHMKTAWLEKILAYAQEIGLPVIGFDELPPLAK